MYWVVRKVPILKNWNAEGLNFSVHLLNLYLLRHEFSGQPNIIHLYKIKMNHSVDLCNYILSDECLKGILKVTIEK